MKIAVYGMGRFGAFWAGLLSERVDVSGFSRNKRAYPPGIGKIEREEDLADYDTIFLCCAINAVDEVLERICTLISPGTTVIDTCSVKVYPAELMEKYLPESCGIIATHPMFGPDSGREGVEGLPIVVHTIRDVKGCGNFWTDTFNSMKMVIHYMEPDQHDREAAFTQGITHFVGRVLQELGLEDSEIATLGYRKLLEIVEQTCNDPIQLFLDLQKYNSHTEEMRVRLQRALNSTMELF